MSGGLHEGLIRRYTNQLLQAVEELHKNLVVHRDIKCANIFLSNQGNCLKLGDFGSAVKIQFHNTMPGELKGYVGTQAYMVMFMKFCSFMLELKLLNFHFRHQKCSRKQILMDMVELQIYGQLVVVLLKWLQGKDHGITLIQTFK